MDAPNSVGQRSRGRILEQVSRCAGVQGAAQIAGAGKGGKNDHARRRALPFQLGCHFQAAHFRHLDIGEQEFRFLLQRELQGFFSVACLADDADVMLNFQQRRQRSQHHALVFGNDHANTS